MVNIFCDQLPKLWSFQKIPLESYAVCTVFSMILWLAILRKKYYSILYKDLL